MRVAVLIKGHPPESGGGHTFETDTLQALLQVAGKSRHRFIVVAEPQWIARLGKDGCPDNVELLATRRFGVPWQYWSTIEQELPFIRHLGLKFGKLSRSVISARADIAWFLSGGGFEPLSVPYIATVWDLMHRTHPWFPELSQNGAWEIRESRLRRFLQRAMLVISGTEIGRRELGFYYQIDPERVLINPHPSPLFALKASREPKVPLPLRFRLVNRYFFYPAQFWAHKNHATLLTAFKEVVGEHLDVTLVLTGSDQGNLRYVRDLCVQLGLEKHVLFTGFVTREELVWLYQNAIALVYASMCGPENLPPLEAFTLGCPVIASHIPGSVEQLGDAAILVEPSNARHWHAAMLTMMKSDAVRAELVSKGLERAQKGTFDLYVTHVIEKLDTLEPICGTWGQFENGH